MYCCAANLVKKWPSSAKVGRVWRAGAPKSSRKRSGAKCSRAESCCWHFVATTLPRNVRHCDCMEVDNAGQSYVQESSDPHTSRNLPDIPSRLASPEQHGNGGGGKGLIKRTRSTKAASSEDVTRSEQHGLGAMINQTLAPPPSEPRRRRVHLQHPHRQPEGPQVRPGTTAPKSRLASRPAEATSNAAGGLRHARAVVEGERPLGPPPAPPAAAIPGGSSRWQRQRRGAGSGCRRAPPQHGTGGPPLHGNAQRLEHPLMFDLCSGRQHLANTAPERPTSINTWGGQGVAARLTTSPDVSRQSDRMPGRAGGASAPPAAAVCRKCRARTPTARCASCSSWCGGAPACRTAACPKHIPLDDCGIGDNLRVSSIGRPQVFDWGVVWERPKVRS